MGGVLCKHNFNLWSILIGLIFTYFWSIFFAKEELLLKWNLSETVVIYLPAKSQFLISCTTKIVMVFL